MNLLPKPEQNITEKLFRLSILVIGLMALQSLLISPLLSLVFDTHLSDISLIQNKSNALAAKTSGESDDIQTTVINGARTIKSQLTQNQYWFVYISQMSFNIICFLLSALVFRHFAFSKADKLVDWKKTRFMLYFISPALLISATPIIGETLQLNDRLGINFLKEKIGVNINQNSIGSMIFSYAVFIPENSVQLISSLLFVAIIPAIGEELLFRGSLQKLLYQKNQNIHSSIFITAFIFSLIHFEITAFFYRFFLGVLLGYTYFWSRTIVIPIIIHAFNNGLMVFQMYYFFQAENPMAEKNTSLEQNPSTALLFSTLMMAMILLMFYMDYRRTESRNEFIE